MKQIQKSSKGRKIIAALDVGSSKTACLIIEHVGAPDAGGSLANVRVLGIGYQRSQGLKGGMVFDSTAVEASIRGAVDKAERLAGISVDQLHISMNAGRIKSQHYGVTLPLGGGQGQNFPCRKPFSQRLGSYCRLS